MSHPFVSEVVKLGAAPDAAILTSDNADPRLLGYDAPVGSFYIRRDTREWFRKATTDPAGWELLGLNEQTPLLDVYFILVDIRNLLLEMSG